MPTVRAHSRVQASAEKVWRALRDSPAHRYHPMITSSVRSKDGTIIRDVWQFTNLSPDVRGTVLTVTVHSKVVECDDQLRRLRLDMFAAEGTYDLIRPMAGDDTVFDVLDDDDGCVLVVSTTNVPENRVATVNPIWDGYVAGLKALCESDTTTRSP